MIEKESAASHRNGYGAPTQSLALREVDEIIDIGNGHFGVLSPTDPSARGAHTRYRRPSVFEVRNTPTLYAPDDVSARDPRTPRRRSIASRRAARVSDENRRGKSVWSLAGPNGIVSFLVALTDGSRINSKRRETRFRQIYSREKRL